MSEKKVILNQCAGTDGEESTYLVTELHGTVMFDIGQKLTKREVTDLLTRPNTKVVVKSPKVVQA